MEEDNSNQTNLPNPVLLQAWNDLLVKETNSDTLQQFLSEPDPQQRREYIRDIYHYLNANQLILITKEIAEIKKSMNPTNTRCERSPTWKKLFAYASLFLAGGTLLWWAKK